MCCLSQNCIQLFLISFNNDTVSKTKKTIQKTYFSFSNSAANYFSVTFLVVGWQDRSQTYLEEEKWEIPNCSMVLLYFLSEFRFLQIEHKLFFKKTQTYTYNYLFKL